MECYQEKNEISICFVQPLGTTRVMPLDDMRCEKTKILEEAFHPKIFEPSRLIHSVSDEPLCAATDFLPVFFCLQKDFFISCETQVFLIDNTSTNISKPLLEYSPGGRKFPWVANRVEGCENLFLIIHACHPI